MAKNEQIIGGFPIALGIVPAMGLVLSCGIYTCLYLTVDRIANSEEKPKPRRKGHLLVVEITNINAPPPWKDDFSGSGKNIIDINYAFTHGGTNYSADDWVLAKVRETITWEYNVDPGSPVVWAV